MGVKTRSPHPPAAVKVCHITSVHPAEDVRIFQKECVSLAKAGYDVTLVQQGESYEKNGVHILGFGAIASNRLQRMLFTSRKAYRKALAADADIYHLHDPELLPYGLKLKRRGKTVIFDSHEDVPADILGKEWLPVFLRKGISRLYMWYENRCFARMDAVIGVTPHICDRIRRQCARAELITNYPILEDCPPPSFTGRKIVFPGLVSPLWNIHTLLQALETLPDVTLELRSRTVEEPYGSTLREMPAWKQVNFPGKVSHAEVVELLSQCSCGVALAQPCANSGWNLGTLGNTKLFEYMMAGIPVVCTNFILWKELTDRWQCGICVDPENTAEIASAIRYLLDHLEEARRMGQNGRKAVEKAYNWEVEEKKLLALYQELAKEG